MSYQNNISNQNLSTQNMQSDRPLLIAVIFLVVIGLMAIFSASAPKCIEMGVNPARFLIQQLIGVIAGFIGLKFLSNFHYKKLMTYTLPWAAFVIIMLIMVKVAGVTVNGAQRWINFGPLSLQPSEFAKPAVVLLLAGVFYRNAEVFDNNKIVTAFIPILIMMGLIYMQPNLSMLLLLLFTSVAIFTCAGGSIKLLITGAACVIPLFIMKGLKGYQSSRITPREWARLQGFPDSFVLPLADTHLYKQFGNSVTVNVIAAIAEKIKEVLDNVD